MAKDSTVRVDIKLTKNQRKLFRRYIHAGGWTITGWMRKQIMDATEIQARKEVKPDVDEG